MPPIIDSAAARPRTAVSRRSAVVAAAATASGLAVTGLVASGAIGDGHAAVALVAGHAAVATAAGFTARDAAARAAGFSRKVWRLFGMGLASWALGCLVYIAFILGGGSVADPAPWTQIGFLAAYPFWYRALFLLRQPMLARTAAQRAEAVVVETTALALVAVVLGAILWLPALGAGQNVALILPAVLDLILCAGLYNAVRRSRLSADSTHGWLAASFFVLAASDIAVSYSVPRGHTITAALALAGYSLALGLFGTAARHPIRMSETQSGLGRSTAVVGILALALVGPAGVLLHGASRYAVWAVGGLLVAWLWSRITVESRTEIDALTGFLTADAFERHLAGVLAVATPDRPAAVIITDIDDFDAWTAARGFAAGDRLIAENSVRLGALTLPEGGAWARLTADRFGWLGMITDAPSARAAAFRIGGTAGYAREALGASTGFAIIPGDADTPADAMAAAKEAMRAARQSRRAVVAFDRGRLDGVQSSDEYGTSVRRRRARIEQLIADAGAITPAFQPIMAIPAGTVRGYEALSRFTAEPPQGPDRWIAEAHAVGLGIELEAECMRRALRRRTDMPIGTYLSLNASPGLLMSHVLDDVLSGEDLAGIVFEITEHEHVEDYAQLADRLALLRGRGARVAIDDVGAGHSSMVHVMNLRPDYVKVDRGLLDGIHLDSAKRALMRSLVALSAELHAELVAEGVETVDELEVLRDLQVGACQGYLVARPQPGFAVDRDIPSAALGVLEIAPGARVGGAARTTA